MEETGKDLVPLQKDGSITECPKGCSAYNGAHHSCVIKNTPGTVIRFNKHAEKFFKIQLVSGIQKYFTFLRNRLQGKHAIRTQDGKTETLYPAISTKAMQILRKYNKVHCSISSRARKSRIEVQNLQLEDLTSPCLGELMAFHINVRERRRKTKTIPGQFDHCKLQTIDGTPSLSITLSDSKVLAVDLTCSICLETFFDPVSLTCNHIFCYMCACSAGRVLAIDGLKAADSKSKCPLCRKAGVFGSAVRMSQLNILLRRKFPEYWEERCEKERQARIIEAKAYWEFQCRAFVGIN